MEKKTIGPFELEGRLGSGGMGIVYRAIYTKTGQPMALKILSPEMSANESLAARFEREIAVLKKLKHDNIVRYYGGGKHGSQRFYAMELVEGGALDKLLRERKRMSWEQVIDCGLQICSALEHAHSLGVIHRDLKPANLLIAPDGTFKLTDFGIARDTGATALTSAGRTVGTYGYMAPEQIRGKPPVSHKTDLYALGCVLFQLLTGQTPFKAETEMEMLMHHLQDPPPRVTSLAIDCPIWLESVVMKLLEKEPENRYHDAVAVQRALQEVGRKLAEQSSLATHSLQGGPTSLTVDYDAKEVVKLLKKKTRKKKKKQKGPFYEQVWFLSVCLLLLVGGVTYSLWPASEETLYASALPLMESDDVVQQQDARRLYLEPMLRRFPDGQYAAQAREFIERLEVDRLEKRTQTNMRLRKEPESEAERLFVSGLQFEDFGDRVTAMEKYRSMIELLKDREDDRLYVLLARRRMAKLEEAGGTGGDRVELVNESLRRADEHYDNGRVLDARKIWNSIIELYTANLEMEPQVKQARARLREQSSDGPQ
jgi:eukaryotic-like serine/threonine-protein kinase